MLFAGIDVGSLTAEAVVVEKKRVVAFCSIGVRPNPLDSAREVFDRMIMELEIDPENIRYTVSTGYGREKIQEEGMAQENVSEISCHGYGAFCLCPEVRTIIDIGGQDAKVIKVNEKGELENFVMNDKCAAGTGHFLEVMCRALDVTLDELGPMSLRSRKPMEISSRCSIYAETEVIHYLQRGASKEDLAAGINRAMAQRVLALARRIKPEGQIMMTGGVAKNIAVRTELEKMLKTRMLKAPIDPQIIGAYGAAMFAQKSGGGK